MNHPNTVRVVDQRNKEQTIAKFVDASDARLFADIKNTSYKRPRFIVRRNS